MQHSLCSGVTAVAGADWAAAPHCRPAGRLFYAATPATISLTAVASIVGLLTSYFYMYLQVSGFDILHFLSELSDNRYDSTMIDDAYFYHFKALDIGISC